MPFSREREETDKVTHAANAWWNVLFEPKERHKGKAPYKCSLRCGKNGLPLERTQSCQFRLFALGQALPRTDWRYLVAV